MMRANTFTLADYPVIFSGFDRGDTWNGFSVPLFSREQLLAVLDYVTTNGGEKSYTVDGERITVTGEDETIAVDRVSIDGENFYSLAGWCFYRKGFWNE